MGSGSDDDLLTILKSRFDGNTKRHLGIAWDDIERALREYPEKILALRAMEDTGGEPDIVVFPEGPEGLAFFDCSPESPVGRRSLCYDGAALESRKDNKPLTSAVEMAASMGIGLLSEELYRRLQDIVELDIKTSSWVLTPDSVRKLGGALFCDRRYGRVFTYHNGAESYYAARGFRGFLSI